MTAQAGGAAFSAILDRKAAALPRKLLRQHTDRMPNTQPDDLRATLRTRRQALSYSKRHASAKAVTTHLIRSGLLASGQRIAIYQAIDGELDLTSTARAARQAQCLLYAHVITSMKARTMEFVRLPACVGTAFGRRSAARKMKSARTHFGLSISPRLLDVVLVPSVAFDRRGRRLGFGAGFYDRKFAFKRVLHCPRPPLIGVGYAFQCVTSIKQRPWDVVMDLLVTERGLLRPQRLTVHT
jgi:5-formyltetrahydrofolate cyclo-ligase